MPPLEDSTDSKKFESSGRLTDRDGDDDNTLNGQATKYLKAALTQFGLSPQHRCCTTVQILKPFSDRS